MPDWRGGGLAGAPRMPASSSLLTGLQRQGTASHSSTISRRSTPQTTFFVPLQVMSKVGVLLLLSGAVCLVGSITVPARPPGRWQQQAELHHLQNYQRPRPSGGRPYQRSGPQPLPPPPPPPGFNTRNLRLRTLPVKRIYLPMKMMGQRKRYIQSPGLGGAGGANWRGKEQPHRQHWQAPYRPLSPQPQRLYQEPAMGGGQFATAALPPRKIPSGGPVKPVKYLGMAAGSNGAKAGYPKYPKKKPLSGSAIVPSASYNTYSTLQHNFPGLATDSYSPQQSSYSPQQSIHSPQQSSYKPQSTTTYGRPNPLGSPEPPNKSSNTIQFKDEPATSYVNVYQGERASEEGGQPSYAFSQTHSQNYENKYKGSVHSDGEALLSNHRPVYKPEQSDSSQNSVSSLQTAESTGTSERVKAEGERGGGGGRGSFTPPKQTFGFQPYETEIGGALNKPSGGYVTSQSESLGPNYFTEQSSQKMQA